MTTQVYVSPLAEIINIEIEDFILTGSDVIDSPEIDSFVGGGNIFE